MISETIKIWDNISSEDDFTPTLNTYLLSGDKKRGAVLICPGGGYRFLSEREAEPIAMQFNAAGFHAFVLYYSVAPRKHPQPLLDVSRAMCIIRENAENWNIEPEKIAVCGFSAGGHLAASLGVHWDKPYIQNAEGITKGMNHPNALVLCYPVISSGQFAHRDSFDKLLGEGADNDLLKQMSLELQVSEKTPPAFIWHTFEDPLVPVENSIFFAQALRKENIPFELHVYTKGGHGLALATAETDWVDVQASSWVKLCTQWLEETFKSK